MKAFGILSLVLAMAIAAYLMMRQQEPGAGGVSPSAAKNQVDRARQAAATANVTVVKQAVRAFQGEKQRLPKDLEELKEAGYLQSVPPDITYASDTGDVSVTIH